MSSSTKVAVGLSGGVDSGVAAHLLKRQGYDVIGLTMQIWDGAATLEATGRSACYGPGEDEDIDAARGIARELGIPHHVIPMADEYRAEVLDYFRTEYLAGRTPNPCVRCNRTMKFGVLLEKALEAGLSFTHFATGHYARVEPDSASRRHVLKRAVDHAKDQSYFLSQLTQKQLGRLLLPLGSLTKTRVKALARDLGWHELAEKQESQDFLECKDYSALFRSDDARPGPIVDARGHEVGQHRGVIHYTIGQRKGLGLGGQPEPLYVIAIDARANTVTVGPRAQLLSDRLRAGSLNWIAIAAPPEAPMRVQAKIRQQHTPADADIARVGPGSAEIDVVFAEPQMSVSPGQTAVFYQGDCVVGGGTILPILNAADTEPSHV